MPDGEFTCEVDVDLTVGAIVEAIVTVCADGFGNSVAFSTVTGLERNRNANARTITAMAMIANQSAPRFMKFMSRAEAERAGR